jgi:hypothetical protein
MSRGVVITGMGAVSPLGIGARTLYERWLAGRSGIEDGKGAATEFEPTEHLSIKEARRADRFSQFAIVAGDEALAEAGWEANGDKPYDSDRIGCVIGTGIGGINTLERGKEILIESGPKKVPPLSVPLMMSNAAAAAVSMRFKLLGPCHGIVSACSGGADAIGAAKAAVASGVSAASEPPVTTASASPVWIMRAEVPIACAPAAQADSVANEWPRSPCRMETAAAAELPISSGIESGETAFGPDSSSFLWLASSVPMPPMPVPISVATRSAS